MNFGAMMAEEGEGSCKQEERELLLENLSMCEESLLELDLETGELEHGESAV